MRPERTVQATLFEVFAGHQIGCELKAISDWLDGQRALLSLVASDLRREGRRPTGRRGLPAETVLRCALLKQQRQLSYEELAFDLEDSASFRALARLPLAWSPKKSVLHQTISAVRPETWEAVNRALVASAQQEKLETGALVRIDSTVTEALMHAPSDSTLLGDAVRVMSRLLRQAAKPPGALVIRWRDHRRLAKRCAIDIQYSRGKDHRRRLYRKLIAATHATRAALPRAVRRVSGLVGMAATQWRPQVDHYLPLIARLLDPSERRVLHGQAVPAREKLVSLFVSRTPTLSSRACPGAGRGRPRRAVRPQAHPHHWQERLDPRSRHRAGQPGRCRALCADARPPYQPLRHPAPPDGRRWQLCQPRQSQSGQSPRRQRCRLSQKAWSGRCRHGQEPVGVPQAAQLPRRYRGRHFLLQARLCGGRCTWRGRDRFKA
jgi:IS5 family transposase